MGLANSSSSNCLDSLEFTLQATTGLPMHMLYATYKMLDELYGTSKAQLRIILGPPPIIQSTWPKFKVTQFHSQVDVIIM